jgi:hypothetical protein
MDERLTPEERQAQREREPAEPLSPAATDPRSPEPHHALNNPADEPDPTEYPDPYERRPDPRAPDHEGPAAPSTSEPHPPSSFDELKPVKGDREGG